jgi:hypothetical protein
MSQEQFAIHVDVVCFDALTAEGERILQRSLVAIIVVSVCREKLGRRALLGCASCGYDGEYGEDVGATSDSHFTPRSVLSDLSVLSVF